MKSPTLINRDYSMVLIFPPDDHYCITIKIIVLYQLILLENYKATRKV